MDLNSRGVRVWCEWQFFHTFNFLKLPTKSEIHDPGNKYLALAYILRLSGVELPARDDLESTIDLTTKENTAENIDEHYYRNDSIPCNRMQHDFGAQPMAIDSSTTPTTFTEQNFPCSHSDQPTSIVGFNSNNETTNTSSQRAFILDRATNSHNERNPMPTSTFFASHFPYPQRTTTERVQY